jgi:DNA-binding transcriptional ArsR family regulator
MTEAHDTLIDPELLEEVAPVLRTLSHPMRLRIVDFLKDGEQPVSRIVEATGKTQALTSHQLGILRSHGVIKGRREGTIGRNREMHQSPRRRDPIPVREGRSVSLSAMLEVS